MADFVSSFWNWFIAVPTVLGIVAMFVLIIKNSQGVGQETAEGAEPTGHVWDEDLQELNNPLPKWWLNMFYLTLFFGIAYLALYPGIWKGFLGWTSTGQWQQEMKVADETYGPLFEKYAKMDLKAVAADPEANKMGERLFATYCTVCHGADARGARGFPNLRDNDWLYGGTPDKIEQSITNGRNGVMPPKGGMASLDNEGVFNVVQYVRSLSGIEVDAQARAKGEKIFKTVCFACHGADGKGNQAIGAPNLTDHTWLYGGSQKRITETILKGRQGHMPAHGEFLGKAKIHLLAAYIYSLSHKQ